MSWEIQAKLSWKNIGESSLVAAGTAGISSALGIGGEKAIKYNSFLQSTEVQLEKIAINQTMSFAIGHERHFDWKIVLASFGNAVAGVGASRVEFGTDLINDLWSGAAHGVSTITMNEILGKNADTEMVAANILGTFLGNQISLQARNIMLAIKQQASGEKMKYRYMLRRYLK